MNEPNISLRAVVRDEPPAPNMEMPGRQLCALHPRVDYRRAWGCPECVKEMRDELAATKARLEVAIEGIKRMMSWLGSGNEVWNRGLDALKRLDAPAADTDAKPPLPSVVGARNLKVCRICGNKISTQGWPVGAAEDFGELIFPEKVTLNFGYEFAHTACLAADTGGKESV